MFFELVNGKAEMCPPSVKLTVGASSLAAEGSHVLSEGVGQQQADVHRGAPLHCQRTADRKVELDMNKIQQMPSAANVHVSHLHCILT